MLLRKWPDSDQRHSPRIELVKYTIIPGAPVRGAGQVGAKVQGRIADISAL